MEPASLAHETSQSPREGSLENPEVLENVPGHVIPILEREFDDFDTESTRFLKGELEEDDVHQVPPQAGRLRPAPAGRADGPGEAADGRRHARPARRLRRRHRALRAAAQGSHHDAPEHPDAPRAARRRGQADPRARRRRPVEPRGLRQHDAQRHRRPARGHARGRAVRHHPVRRRLRPLLRASPDHAGDAAQGQDGIHGHRRGQRDHPDPRHGVRARSCATASAASRSASAAAPRSCRASRRRCTSSSNSTTATT